MQIDREIVIQLARDAGGGLSCIAEPLEHPWKFSEAELMRLVSLVAQRAAEAEREAVLLEVIQRLKNSLTKSECISEVKAILTRGVNKEKA